MLISYRSGNATIEIDNQPYEIVSEHLFTITPKQYYQFIEINKCDVYILEFIYDTYCLNSNNSCNESEQL